MKILMLNPPFLEKYSRSSRSPAVTKSGTIYYPLWLSYATGVLEANGHEVLFIDAPAEGFNLSDIREKIMNFAPGMLVIDTSTPSIENDVHILEEIKSWFSKDKVVSILVGTHPTALPEKTMQLSEKIDIIARREYDYTLNEIADQLDSDDYDFVPILGITYRKNKKILHNQDRPYIKDLDKIPFVSSVYKKHLNIRNYFYAHTKPPVISIFGGRGCPNRCFYCVYPQVMFGHQYRYRSAENLVAELEYIKKEFPSVNEVLIDDDNFTVDQAHVVEFCKLIIKKKLQITWTVEARVNLQFEVMKIMKKAGCRLLVAGFESGDQQILDNIDKGTTIEQAEMFRNNAKRAKLRVHGCFMVGNKGETNETMKKTLELALKLDPDTAQFFPLMVYPGTKAYKWAEENHFIKAENFREWLTAKGLHNCVVETDKLSANELVLFCDHARKEFYLRAKYLVKKIFDLILHPSEAYRTAKAARLLLGHMIFKKD